MTLIRLATADDAPALAAIYGHHVAHGFGSFEETAPTAAEMAERWAAIIARGLPYLVGEVDGAVAGFAYAGPYRTRSAYRYTVEDSVYVGSTFHGRGVGKLLLMQVIDACESLGLRRMLALIGDSGNDGSIGLHTALGFERMGLGRSVGFKHGRWVDIVHMQKSLNGGDTVPPEGPGIELSGH